MSTYHVDTDDGTYEVEVDDTPSTAPMDNSTSDPTQLDLGGSSLQAIKDAPSAFVNLFRSIPQGLSNVANAPKDIYNSLAGLTGYKDILDPEVQTSGQRLKDTGSGIANLAAGLVGNSYAGPAGGSAGLTAVDKTLQLLGVNPETTLAEDANKFAYNTTQAGLFNLGGKAVGATTEAIANKLPEVSKALDRKSFGASYNDYAQTADDLHSVAIPEGVESQAKNVLDKYLSTDSFPNRNPSTVLDDVRTTKKDYQAQLGDALDAYDKAGSPAIKPTFDNALKFIDDGRAGQYDDVFLKKITDLEDRLAKPGRDTVQYLQNEKNVIGESWNKDNNVENQFNRKLYTDVKNSIEQAVPEAKGINSKLQDYRILEPIAKRSLARSENADFGTKITNALKTTGGVGVPFIAGSALGNPLLGLATGVALNRLFQTPGGLAKVAKAVRGAGNLASSVSSGFDSLPSLSALAVGNNQPLLNREVHKTLFTNPPDTKQDEQPTFKPTKSQAIKQDVSADMSVRPELLKAVGFVESGNNPKAIGPKTKYGTAKGEYQLLDSTGEEWHDKLGLPGEYDPHDEKQAPIIAAAYLSHLTDKYDGDERLALAAYNWGMGNLDKLIKREGTSDFDDLDSYLPKETQNYVSKITRRAGSVSV